MSLPQLPPVLARALDARGYTTLTPVQTAVLAPGTEGQDLLVSAQTGSGKTVAYGMAMAGALLDGERIAYAEAPLALIIAPTRELALQVQTELTWLYAGTGARIAACVGGMDPIRERRQLERGVHIVVGTPGRLRDHMERGALELGSLAAVVLDEADEMLDLGFSEDLKFILDATPETRRTLLFSATLPRPIIALARQYQNDAQRIEIAGSGSGHADIEYRCVPIAHAKMDRAVVNLLRAIDPACALVFCATRVAVQRLSESLATRGFSCVALSGEMTQAERNRALTALREGRAKVCVATDVAARGLDVAGLTLVIHAELPKDGEILQHRSGRTGRAGKKGVSVLLVPPSRRRFAESMLQRADIQYSWTNPPSADDILAADRERLLVSELLTEPGETDDAILAAALLERYAPHQVATALSKLYRAGLPVPEDLQEFVEHPRQAERRARGDDDGPRKAPREKNYDRPREGRRDDGPRSREPRRFESDGFDPKSFDPRAKDRRHSPKAAEHGLDGGVAWFRISVGRERNADPKWLLPEICRQGDVTKKDIGEIRIFDRETRFQLALNLADEFAAKIAERKKGGVIITPAVDGEPGFYTEDDPAPRPERKREHKSERKSYRKAEQEQAYEPPQDARPAGGENDFAKPGKKPFHKDGHKDSKKPFAKNKDGHKHKDGKKPFAKNKDGKKAVRFGDLQKDEERRQKRKARKKEKRKLAALARG